MARSRPLKIKLFPRTLYEVFKEEIETNSEKSNDQLIIDYLKNYRLYSNPENNSVTIYLKTIKNKRMRRNKWNIKI